MAQQSINFKRGDTFRMSCAKTDSLGVAADLTGVTIESQVRVDAFVDDLTITIATPSSGEFILSATATQTALWPIGNIYCDIQFTDADVESSETFIVYTVEDITRAD